MALLHQNRVMNKFSSINVNRTFIQNDLDFNTVLQAVAQNYLYIVHEMFSSNIFINVTTFRTFRELSKSTVPIMFAK